MEEYIYYNNLYDCYYSLLTDRQRSYFEDYYFSNLSLSEIAENDGVSKNAAHKQIKNVVEKLKEYENKLHLYAKKYKILDLIKDIDDDKIKREIEDIVNE